MNEIGNMLRVTRESSGVSIEEASRDLNIKDVILENIEDGKIGSFQDVFQLKSYISEYAHYLGLDSEKLIDSFNEYLFTYTSKIPVKEIEKKVQQQAKEEKDVEKVVSPYTKVNKSHSLMFYRIIYITLAVIAVILLVWSLKQITINKRVTDEISYVE
ncbi:MAG: helix-turn-helix domain-containing protein [Bacilli bacterium]|nr:helix-turn-helix domain-containing protein [Bacilli bacterium]